jgi:hypothetical protein
MLQLLLESNVILGLVAIQETRRSGVVGVVSDTVEHLVHGSDSRTTSNHVDLVVRGGFVVEMAEWSADIDRVTNSHRAKELGHQTMCVDLLIHQQRELATLALVPSLWSIHIP